METVLLDRRLTGNQGTFGEIVLGGAVFHTGELPWRENKSGVSCIPEGVYRCLYGPSPRFGHAYEVTGVPGRSRILIHNGNYCGDIGAGFMSHVLGCIILGQAMGTLKGQRAVLLSRPAVTAFVAALEQKPFVLEVRNNGLF